MIASSTGAMSVGWLSLLSGHALQVIDDRGISFWPAPFQSPWPHDLALVSVRRDSRY